MNGKKSKRWQRVDMQVILLTTSIVGLSFLVVYFFGYYITYNDMIVGLEDRANSIYTYVQDSLNPDTFYDIDEKEDMQSEAYHSMKESLENVKEATGVMYLYTAKYNEDGEYVYLVDGLSYDSPDFRYPGDLIEPEVVKEMEKAYGNEIILPDEIKHTTWGNIFVSYFPIHDGEKVIGVLGIEFPAEHQYETFEMIRIGTPIIAFFACLIASFIAVFAFKRISNPMFQDLSNTDFLTNLKNRNAFELDVQNFNKRELHQHMAIVVLDLNDLKKVNDEQGHKVGDAYIQKAALLLRQVMGQDAPVYRIGGDEFTILVQNANDTKMIEYVQAIQKAIDKANEVDTMKVSISIGYAIFDETKDDSFYDTYHRADCNMYEAKRVSKSS